MAVVKRPRIAGLSRAGLWIAWAALLVPTFVSASFHIDTDLESIRTATSELSGIEIIRRIESVIEAADRYRTATTGSIVDPRAASAVDAALASLERYDDGLPPALANGTALRDIVTDWPAVEREGPSHEARLTEWIDRFLTLIASTSQRTKISFDNDVATDDSGDAFAIEYQRSGERYARLVEIARSATAANIQLDDRIRATRVATEAVDSERLGYLDMELSIASDSALQDLQADVTALDVRSLAFSDYVRRTLARDGLTPTPAQLAVGRDVVARHDDVRREIARHFEMLTLRHIEGYRTSIVLTVVLAALVTLLSFAIVAWFQRALAITRELERRGAEQARERAIGAVQRELVTAEEKFRATFEQVPVGILILDEALDTAETNPALETLVSDFDEIVDTDRHLFAKALAGTQIEPFERRYNRIDGSSSWAEVELRGMTGGIEGRRYVVGTFRDISESKALSKRLVYDATHDALTGLPNRTAFSAALAEVTASPRAAGNNGFALLYLDLDGFKLVNDSVGHHAGDALLVETARRLRATMRHDDVICRMGGDEFAILLPESDADDSVRIATRIVAALREPMSFAEHTLAVRASIGIIVPQRDLVHPEEILRDADTAMYHAKSLGGGQYVVFDASMHEHVRRRMQLTTDLREALETETLSVVYQPIFDLRTMRLLGYEALARWTHPVFGVVGPSEFVPIAEESGSIEALGRFVLLAACEQLARWRESEPEAHAWRMNVNVAAQQILSGSIVNDLRRALARTNVPADRVFLEITESVLLDNVERATETLEALRRFGSRVCIDDFGTGYSSLRYLQHLPIDGIKVDRSFVSDGGDGIASEPIVQMLVTLSRVLGLSIVVEGIETQTQLRRLLALGCTMGQGYFFSPPIPASDAPSLARRFAEMTAS